MHEQGLGLQELHARSVYFSNPDENPLLDWLDPTNHQLFLILAALTDRLTATLDFWKKGQYGTLVDYADGPKKFDPQKHKQKRKTKQGI